MAAGRPGAAQADCRRGDRRGPRREAVPRRAPDGRRCRNGGRSRRLGRRARRLRRPGRLPLRADGRGGSALPDVHVRHDGEAEGDRAHDRRLPRRRRHDPPLHLRPQARPGRLLVRRRHRLDHRAQLHRLRAALQRRDVRPLRGDARLPGQGPLVVDHRALRGDDPLHGADRDPRAHEVGAGARRQARSHEPAPARLGRRADQPGGLGLVPRAHRRRPDAGRRHVVADRDRDDHDHPVAGSDDAEAGLGHEALPGRRGGGVQRGRGGGRSWRRRLPRPEAAVARDDARDLRRRRALSPTRTSPATERGSTRTATTGSSAASTTS